MFVLNRSNMKLIIVLSFLTAVLAAPPTNNGELHKTHVHPSPRITNGREAVPHSIPHQVFLTQFDALGTSWLCGGILISPKYVLTSGTCGDGAVSAQVLLGAHNIVEREETQVTISAKSIKVHEKLDISQFLNDIAVLELETEAPINVNIQPAKLPSRNDVNETLAGKTGTVSGWGITDSFGTEISPVLNYVQETVITNAQCSEELGPKNSFVLHDSNVCLEGKNKKNSCSGDEGGPLSVDGVVVGIVSFGISYCLPGYPSAFTKLTSFLDWIEANTDVVIQ